MRLEVKFLKNMLWVGYRQFFLAPQVFFLDSHSFFYYIG